MECLSNDRLTANDCRAEFESEQSIKQNQIARPQSLLPSAVLPEGLTNMLNASVANDEIDRVVSSAEQARSKVHQQLIDLANSLEDSGEDEAAANVRLAIARLSFLQGKAPE